MSKQILHLPSGRQFGVFVVRLLAVGAVMLLLAALVLGQAAVSRLQVDIRGLKTKIADEQDKQSRLQEQIDRNSDLGRIMSRASELGMGYPDEDSIIYLDPPETDGDQP